MRDRPFINAAEPPRPFSDVAAERRLGDRRELVVTEIQRLEGEAAEATDPADAKRLQCAAEDLRCQLDRK